MWDFLKANWAKISILKRWVGVSDVSVKDTIELKSFIIRETDRSISHFSDFILHLEKEFRVISRFALKDQSFFLKIHQAISEFRGRTNEFMNFYDLTTEGDNVADAHTDCDSKCVNDSIEVGK